MKRSLALLFVVLISVATVFPTGCKRDAQSTPLFSRKTKPALRPVSAGDFSAKWWQSAPSDERQGYFAGASDCLTYDLQSNLNFPLSWSEYEKRVTQFYTRVPGQAATPVYTVFKHLGKPAKKTLNAPHFLYGDDWWRDASPMARIGFVEGYTYCRRQQPNATPDWSFPVETYVRQLNSLYKVDQPQINEASQTSESIAIAVALQKCCDQPLDE